MRVGIGDNNITKIPSLHKTNKNTSVLLRFRRFNDWSDRLHYNAASY